MLDELEKDTSANKDQIETQQLKLQEQELDISNLGMKVGPPIRPTACNNHTRCFGNISQYIFLNLN
jgi:hypothetical protein